jgi:hypothetical protein
VQKLAIVTPKSRTLGGLTLFGQMVNKIGHLSCKTTINNATKLHAISESIVQAISVSFLSRLVVALGRNGDIVKAYSAQRLGIYCCQIKSCELTVPIVVRYHCRIEVKRVA